MRLLGKGALALAGVALVAIGGLYGGSSWVRAKTYDVPVTPIAVPHDSASVAEGGRLAHAYGCRGCHGPDGEGRVFVDDLIDGRVVAPAFARRVPLYSDAQLARLIRHGVRRDGTGQLAMPSHALVNLSDDDVARIIAWLRTLKPSATDVVRPSSFGPETRWRLLDGDLPSQVVPADIPSPRTRPANIGSYYVHGICLSCHSLTAPRPIDGEVAPPLADMAAGYDDAAFARLLHTGVGMSKADLGLMSEVARGDLSALRADEVAAIHTYLKAYAANEPPQ